MIEEKALVGAKEIAEYLCWSTEKLHKLMPILKENGLVTSMLIGKGKKRMRRLIAYPKYLLDHKVQNFTLSKHHKLIL